MGLPFGEESEFVRGVRVVKLSWLAPGMALAKGALKTDDAVLVELADPTPFIRSPVWISASSWTTVTCAKLSDWGVRSGCDVVDDEVRRCRVELSLELPSSARSRGRRGLDLSVSASFDDFRCWMTLGAVGKKAASFECEEWPCGRDMVVRRPAAHSSSHALSSVTSVYSGDT